MKKYRFLILCCLVAIMLGGCAEGALLDLSAVETDPDRFVWSSQSDIDVSMGDVGLFYASGQTIRYYDMAARQEYILCGQANCTHTSEKCSAWFPNGMGGSSVDDVAQVGKYIYCIYDSATADNWADSDVEKSIMLLRIDPSDGTRTVLASFPSQFSAKQDSEDFYASGIDGEGYCGGWAWLRVDMQQPTKLEGESLGYTQLTGVNLDTGEIVKLNEYDGYEYSIACICPENLYFSRSRYVEKMLTQEEFYALADETGAVTIDGTTYTEYVDEYWMWFVNNVPQEYDIFAYHMETGETKLLFSGTTVPVEGSHRHQIIPYAIYGEYQGKTLVQEKLPGENGLYSSGYDRRLSMMDLETGEMTPLLELESGDALAIAQGSDGNLIFPDGKFFYIENKNEETQTGEIWMYDFSTGENRYLFTDHQNVTFRIYGQWNGGYFGKHKDHQYQEGYYWISEEDLFSGNLDAMIHYNVG